MQQQDRGSSSVATRHRSKKSTQQASGRKYRGLTCANCRVRKVRCEGSHPTCKTCEVYNEECRYDKVPPMSQVMAMAERLQQAEKIIEEMRSSTKANTSPPLDPSVSLSNAVMLPAQHDQSGDLVPTLATSPSNDGSASLENHVPGHRPSLRTVNAIRTRISSDAASVRPSIGPDGPHVAELSVDEHGKITYYGPTSAVHDPPQGEPSPSGKVTNIAASPATLSKSDMNTQLSSHAREMSTWEEFAYENASLQTGIPRKTLAKLLQLHWTWVAPMFLWVYRPAFIRDMATGGRYYSEFLLTVMCGHSAKYQNDDSAEFLLTRARRLLGTAIQQPSSIPTVQALLLLSARDLAHGSLSQAWVYSGIAFRMASDLGLQHSCRNVRGLGPVDLEVRRRLFWGCYFWDKATSLYAGRRPAVTEVVDPSSLDLLTDTTELQTWTPYYGDLDRANSTQTHHAPRRSHTVSCFVNSCKLSIIINDIVVELYSKRDMGITEDAMIDIKQRLELWRAQSPLHLKLDPDSIVDVCPPPHIISQNLLYYASVILTNRPFWSVPAYYNDCIKAAQSIEKLILLLEPSFGLENITYLMGYSIYTGASAILEEANKGSIAAHTTLQTFLRALNTGMRRSPLLGRSLNIIIKSMHVANDQQEDQLEGDADRESIQGHWNGYIPAFPYMNPMDLNDFDMSSYFGAPGMDSTTDLNSFPEMQIDMQYSMNYS